MSSRRARSRKISQTEIASPEIVNNPALKAGLDHSLKSQATSLRHHIWAYWLGVCVLFWLMALVYIPLTYFAFCKILPALKRNEISALKELVGIFAQKDFGLVLVVLCIIPIYILSGLLKYNRIDTSPDSNDNDNILPTIFPRF